MISVILFKMGKHGDFHLSFFQIVGAWRDFTVVTKLIKNFKGLYGFGGSCIRDVCMGFEPYLKVHNLVSVHPKDIILGQMINLNMIFHVVVSVYRLVKIWNSSQFPVEFRNGLLKFYLLQFHQVFLFYLNILAIIFLRNIFVFCKSFIVCFFHDRLQWLFLCESIWMQTFSPGKTFS